MAKSVYYYTITKDDKDNKNKEIIDKLKEIFINNEERYRYRRITLELRNQGYEVNHKKVYRIMVKLGLKPLKRNNQSYQQRLKNHGIIQSMSKKGNSMDNGMMEIFLWFIKNRNVL